MALAPKGVKEKEDPRKRLWEKKVQEKEDIQPLEVVDLPNYKHKKGHYVKSH